MARQPEITKIPLKALKNNITKANDKKTQMGKLRGKSGVRHALTHQAPARGGRLRPSACAVTLLSFRVGRGERIPLCPNYENYTPRLITTPLSPPLPNSSTLGLSSFFLPSPFLCSLSHPHPPAPNRQLSVKRISPKAFISTITFPFQKAEGANSFPEFIALYMRPDHAQKGQVAVVLLPDHRCTTRERLQGINCQYFISPRTIAKFICEKIHCNVLF